ncbi:zinc-binding alcohol dehydrogenase family protein [Erwinia billingiae]|uniref:quinone oxidoreductase family protein n=1 Tax=Erwinia billingiae TaxID=182337 RepID=UPI001243F26A|nr:zinc-binding alcohol dehydrogenase family protein [Erwinia billingiae]QEW32184.1 zinc-binding alcohol dehydrogenase family protein [Erwinia billingiae]
MKAAIVTKAGQLPVYGDFAEPVATGDAQRIVVKAAALSHLVKNRASGKHYSASGQYPFIAGIDGVGIQDDGQRVYFIKPVAPYGSMAEQTLVPAAQCIALADDLDDITAAAIANPGMSSWAALTERAQLQIGETVLINGATGISGKLAVQIARYLGAKKIIATGRNPAVLEQLMLLGADVVIPLTQEEEALNAQFGEQFAQGVDVVIDYLWGKSAGQLLTSAAKMAEDGKPVRFVQVGSMSGNEITLSSAILRSKAIALMGSGLGSVSDRGLLRTLKGLLKAAVPAGFQLATHPVTLSRVSEVWEADDSVSRTVFTL